MSGHTAGRKRKWAWAILSVLFALTFAWSFTVMREQVGGVWSILRIGSAVGSGLCLLRLVLLTISSRRLRREHEDDGRREGDGAAETEAEGQPSGEQALTEDRARTYEEVFGLQLDIDGEGLPPAPEDEEWPGDERTEMEPEGQPSADQLPAEERASTADDVEAPQADVDEEVDQVEALEADGGSQEHLQRIREEFRARAEEAALRVKQREADLHEAASVADQER